MHNIFESLTYVVLPPCFLLHINLTRSCKQISVRGHKDLLFSSFYWWNWGHSFHFFPWLVWNTHIQSGWTLLFSNSGNGSDLAITANILWQHSALYITWTNCKHSCLRSCAFSASLKSITDLQILWELQGGEWTDIWSHWQPIGEFPVTSISYVRTRRVVKTQYTVRREDKRFPDNACELMEPSAMNGPSFLSSQL